ncbi:MAG: glycoside hydrolase family 3 N-terminal domain-containing protein [Prolixibacteraceae bacterium]
MKNLLLLMGAFIMWGSAYSQTPVYKNKTAAVEDRVEDLLERMTLTEKIYQMNQWAYGQNTNENNFEDKVRDLKPEIGSLIYRSQSPVFRNQIQKKAMEESRLGIPIIMGFDVIHGFRTIFPIPLAQSCSWNKELVKEACSIAAREAKLSGIDWTFSPMIDVARDARWGRVSEAYGEDPYTNAVFCVEAVHGYQGENLSDRYSIAACLKHYIGYSLSQGGRDYQYSDVSGQTLWETFMPPYEAGVKAGAATLMSGFNDISGVPASANHYTLTEVLKEKWGHDGFVVSDWGSVQQLMNQGVAKDMKECAELSLMAGVEMDMVDNAYLDHLQALVDEGTVPMATIDEAVRRILRIKFRLGLFDNPYCEELPESKRYLQPEDRKVAAELSAESMVLLKNASLPGQENTVLPLSASVKNIALIGPMVVDSFHIIGFWEGYGDSKDAESILEGFKKEFAGKAQLNYAKGCDFDGNNEEGFAEALAMAEKSDVVVLCLGEQRNWSGENGSRSTLALPAIQEKLVDEIKKSGKPLVLVLSSGRPLELVRIEPLADAMLEIWQPGTDGGSATAGIISGRINPSGKLSITFPLTTGQIPMYYNMRRSSRPWGKQGLYKDISSEPLYWFGHGLSYTNYSYGNVKLSATQIKMNEKIIAEVEVSNDGQMDGKETVLWYINDPVASISRPMKEVKFFEKQEIKAGQKVVYRFEIVPERDLSFVDSKGDRHLEAGEFNVLMGNQKVKFELVE